MLKYSSRLSIAVTKNGYIGRFTLYDPFSGQGQDHDDTLSGHGWDWRWARLIKVTECCSHQNLQTDTKDGYI